MHYARKVRQSLFENVLSITAKRRCERIEISFRLSQEEHALRDCCGRFSWGPAENGRKNRNWRLKKYHVASRLRILRASCWRGICKCLRTTDSRYSFHARSSHKPPLLAWLAVFWLAVEGSSGYVEDAGLMMTRWQRDGPLLI